MQLSIFENDLLLTHTAKPISSRMVYREQADGIHAHWEVLNMPKDLRQDRLLDRLGYQFVYGWFHFRDEKSPSGVKDIAVPKTANEAHEICRAYLPEFLQEDYHLVWQNGDEHWVGFINQNGQVEVALNAGCRYDEHFHSQLPHSVQGMRTDDAYAICKAAIYERHLAHEARCTGICECHW